jgi:hypothetical protein
MGNRAVLSEKNTPNCPCVYIHWNGGIESVTAFLKAAAAKMKLLATPPKTVLARRDFLCAEVLYPFFESDNHTTYKLTYDKADKDNGDNGTYIYDADFKLVCRKFVPKHLENTLTCDSAEANLMFDYIMQLPPYTPAQKEPV